MALTSGLSGDGAIVSVGPPLFASESSKGSAPPKSPTPLRPAVHVASWSKFAPEDVADPEANAHPVPNPAGAEKTEALVLKEFDPPTNTWLPVAAELSSKVTWVAEASSDRA